MIKYYDFRKEAYNIYNNKYSFKIESNTFSNIYYTWRKNLNLFSKFSIFNNKYTKDNEIFLRDYSFKYIYNKKGNKLIEHEHVIFISNFFIKKLGESDHYYIDGTFVFPKGFKQMLIILTKDRLTRALY